MYFRTGSLLVIFFVIPALALASGWRNEKYGVAIDSFPSDWKSTASDSLVRLEKEFNKDGYGYAYTESMTFAVSLGETASLETATDQMKQQGYLLQENGRVEVDGGTAPLWIFFHQANDQEISWLAMVLRAGLVYTFEVRGTPLDRNLLADFRLVIDGFHFLPDTRQQGWNALSSADSDRAYSLFRKLVGLESADGNALYGLGLAELALGRSRDALTHLEQADRIIRLGEVRPALGQAYLQTGDPLRATVTWYQILNADFDREEELQPSIDRALAAARITDRNVTSEHRLVWEDFQFLADVVSDDLQDRLEDARSGEFGGNMRFYADVDARCQLLFSATLEHLMVEGGAEVEVHYLVAAFNCRKAISEAITALRRSDLAGLEAAELKLSEATEAFAMAAHDVETDQ